MKALIRVAPEIWATAGTADNETQNDGADLGERSRRHHEAVYTFIVTTASMDKLAIDQGKILREFLGRCDIGTGGNYGGLL